MFEPIKDVALLDPVFRPRAIRFLAVCKEKGIPLCVIETRRTPQRQFFLWCKGRFLDKTMEQKYLGYLDPNIKGEPTAARVTWTLGSRHLGGLAMDVVPLKDGNAWWNAPDYEWNQIYDIAETCGIKSMFRVCGKDRCHLSIDGN